MDYHFEFVKYFNRIANKLIFAPQNEIQDKYQPHGSCE